MVVSSSRFVSFRVSVTLMVGRRRRCWWVWVRVWEVFGLFWALWAFLLVLIMVFWRRVVSLVGCPLVLLQVLGVGVV